MDLKISWKATGWLWAMSDVWWVSRRDSLRAILSIAAPGRIDPPGDALLVERGYSLMASVAFVRKNGFYSMDETEDRFRVIHVSGERDLDILGLISERSLCGGTRSVSGLIRSVFEIEQT